MTESPNPNFIDSDSLTGEMHPIRRTVLAIGSNLGDRLANLQGALSSIADTPEVWVTSVSSVYESDPVDSPDPSAAKFLNAVIMVDTTLSAATLLERALAIEDAFGRERGERNAPRTLDVDLIVVGDRRADEDNLKLPHPRAQERAFVLVPWHQVDPTGEIPGVGAIAELLDGVDGGGLTRRDDLELDAQ